MPKAPTEEADGEQTSTCSRCQTPVTETIPALKHDYGEFVVTREPTCTRDGEKTAVCSICHTTWTETIPASEHSYGQFEVTKQATCTENGVRTAVCLNCGASRIETIPATGHNLVPNANGEYQCSNKLEDGHAVTVVPAVVKDAYDEVKLQDQAKADYRYQNAASAKQFVEKMVADALLDVSPLLRRTVNTKGYTPPTQTDNGEYIYTVTIWSDERAAAAVLETQPLTLVIPAAADPDPDPIPDPDPTPDRDSEETYYISVASTDNGEVIPNTRHAGEGDRVTLSVHPEKGYELDTLTVSNSRGREISLRGSGSSYSFTMPASRVTVEAKFVKIPTDDASYPTDSDSNTQPFTGLGTPGISGIVLNPSPMPFTDVRSTDWFYNNVNYVWKHYLMSGVSDTQFAPSVTTSRAMIWTILARMSHVRTDVNPGATWYERGMLWAMEQGVTDGSNPMSDITREQLAVMLWRAAGSPGGAADLSRFGDAASVSSYAQTAVRWAVANGILNGSDGMLNPKGTATRAQVAAMVARYGDR